jgi:hypothetical protein
MVSNFLTALQSDPSGKSSMAYLSQDLQANVPSGNPVPQLLGIEGTSRSFGISGTHLEDASNYDLVEVGLNVAPDLNQSGDWLVGANGRTFYLTQTPGGWLIAQIAKSPSQS